MTSRNFALSPAIESLAGEAAEAWGWIQMRPRAATQRTNRKRKGIIVPFTEELEPVGVGGTPDVKAARQC